MPKVAKVLSAAAVAALRKNGHKGFYAVGGVPGLHLRVENQNSTQWMLRVVHGAGRHDIGLGPYPLVDLATAREEARKTHLQLRQGIDVVAQREQARAERSAAKEPALTFKQAALDLHAVKAEEFKNDKHGAQWLSSLETYAHPVLGDMDVTKIERDHVLEVLKPIWYTKNETAGRVRQRIELVLDYCAVALKARSPNNPARWKNGLDFFLPKSSKIKKTKHHAALPWKALPSFMADLRTRKAQGAKCLELAILTAARSSEVRLATWRELDLDAGLWTVPAEHMKAGLAHKVPLVGRALELVKAQPKGKPDELVFSSEKGTPLSDNTLSKLMKDMHAANVKAGGKGYLDTAVERIATPHGTARSSFKDWARETLGAKYADEISELALAHVSDDKTRAAYARGELLEERSKLMAEWAEFLSGQTGR